MEKELRVIIRALNINKIGQDYSYNLSDDFLNEIKSVKAINVGNYNLVGYDNKGKIFYHKQYDLAIENYDYNALLNCKLIAFTLLKTDDINWIYLLRRLQQYLLKSHFVGGIAYKKNNEIILFPQIKYQDIYLLKDIVQKKMNDDMIHFKFCNSDGKKLLMVQ